MRKPLRMSFVVSCCILTAALAHGDVVLHPGTITGTVGLTNWTPESGGIAVSSNVNGFNASANLSGGTFVLTTEGDQTYNNVSVSEHLPNANGVSGYFTLNRSDANVYVPFNGTTNLDLVRTGGALTFHVTAAGGTVTSYQASASGTTGVVNEYLGGNLSSSSGADATLPMPAVTVTVTGSAMVAIVDGDGNACTIAMPFPSQTVAIAGGDPTTVSEDLVVSSGCSTGIFGTVGIDALPNGATPYDTYVYVNGPQYKSLDLYGNHRSYDFTGLALGTYYVRAQVTFAAPFAGDTLSLPSAAPNTVTLTDSNPLVERDFLFDGGIVAGDVNLSGTPVARIRSASRRFQGKYEPSLPDGGPTWGGTASAGLSDLPNAHFAGILTTGVWQPWMDEIYLEDVTSALPLRDILTIYRTTDPDIAISAGQTATLPVRALPLTEGQVVFDVIEPPGSPVIGISNPTVYARDYDPATGRNISSAAYNYVTNADTPTVRVVGPPGVYDFDAYATVNGSNARFASSTLTLGMPVDTPVGMNIVVLPTDPVGQPTPVTLEFGEVTQAGQSTVSSTDVGPGAPQGYSLLKIIHDDRYMNVSTSAAFPSQVEVCVQYDPSALGIATGQEGALQLQEYVCASSTSCAWQVVNGVFAGDNGGAAVNTSTHTICGLATRLATFGLTLPDLIQVPPTESCIGSANEPAPLATNPGLCSVAIDNANQVAGGCSGGGGGLMSCTFDGAGSRTLTPGEHEVAIVGTAIDGSTAICTSYVSVADRQAPVADCPPPVSKECVGVTTPVVETATCADNCTCTVSCDGGSAFPLGSTTLACNAVDASGNKGACSTVVTIVDTQSPVTSAYVNPSVLWPPNHKLVPIAIRADATDACDGTPTVTCAATSNEPDNGLGDGDKSGDIQWTNGALFLRAERSGVGTGRVYTITCTATDSSGNQARATATVQVPHDQAAN